MRCTHVDSPLGALLLVRDDVGLTGLYLPTGRHATADRAKWIRDDRGFEDVRTQLQEYFAGDRREFTLPLHPTGTAFQTRVWKALLNIPYGRTSTYGRQAVTLGSPNASRAVGSANGRNPISIIVPCHRLIGADGSLTGYGGGLDAKLWLLEHEAAHLSVHTGRNG